MIPLVIFRRPTRALPQPTLTANEACENTQFYLIGRSVLLIAPHSSPMPYGSRWAEVSVIVQPGMEDWIARLPRTTGCLCEPHPQRLENRAAQLKLPFRQIPMAMHLQRRKNVAMYTSMLDLISNRVQRPTAVAASKSERVAMEHRWGQRSRIGVQVRLHAGSWRAPRHACLLDISASGALLELEPSLPPLKRIEVEIALRKQGRIVPIRISACVVRKADHGVGVEWCEPLPCTVAELVADAISRLKPTG
jgi:hypothetical protein